MYTFTDSGGENLTLRPEATAGIARALISNGMLRGARHKLWCIGPMFRHEKPQKGRYRQFHQLDVEAVGFPGPDIDAELIAMTARLWRQLGIMRVKLQLNSLGTPESRKAYRELLVAYFRSHEARLDADSKRRLEGNPLRILDSKNPEMREIIANAPVLTEHLDAESRAHFDALCAAVKSIGIDFVVNPRLVRGLDYYTRTVFEWTTDALGSQDAVCAGGRYDALSAQLGGTRTPAVGFAMGLERLLLLLEETNSFPAHLNQTVDVYFAVIGQGVQSQALRLARELRQHFPGLRLLTHCGGGKYNAQLKKAYASGARCALILEGDTPQSTLKLRLLDDSNTSVELAVSELQGWLQRELGLQINKTE